MFIEPQTSVPFQPFGGAELNLTGVHLVSIRPSEPRSNFIVSRSINISLLRSERAWPSEYSNLGLPGLPCAPIIALGI